MARLPAADVLLAHSPPEGVNDEPDDRAHRGSPALRAWVERNRPGWLLHGHTLPNPAARVSELGPDARGSRARRGAARAELSRAHGVLGLLAREAGGAQQVGGR